MTLSDLEKRNYIKNNFHQYFELGLNTKITTTETVNLIIPIEELVKENTVTSPPFHHDIRYTKDYNISDILNKYEDTDYINDDDIIECVCNRVIDGDTIEVYIYYEENEEILRKKERIRLVGINAPENSGSNESSIETDDPTSDEAQQQLLLNEELGNDFEEGNSYEISKRFLKKVCFSKEYFNNLDENEEPINGEIFNNKHIFLKVDSKKPKDNYGRTLAVLIADNKNINEVLLKEGLAEIMYIPPSEFYPFDWGNKNTSVAVYNFTNSDIQILSPYFNPDMTNIVFTPKDDFDTIYRYEVYQNVIYIKLNPFSQYITMHLLPKNYDCSDSVLIFKDSMINKRDLSTDYHYYKERDFINSYYHGNEEEDRNRLDPNISESAYNYNNWENKDCHCEFSYNISKSTKNLNNIEICAGYRYNNSTPFYSVHYTGIKDNSSYAIEDRCTLIDANYDKVEQDNTNFITQHHYKNKNGTNVLYIPKSQEYTSRTRLPKSYANINHLFNTDEKGEYCIGKLHHKKLKYINDILYVEEYDEDEDERKHDVASWVDLSRL